VNKQLTLHQKNSWHITQKKGSNIWYTPSSHSFKQYIIPLHFISTLSSTEAPALTGTSLSTARRPRPLLQTVLLAALKGIDL
jgi:hypothetical protein